MPTHTEHESTLDASEDGGEEISIQSFKDVLTLYMARDTKKAHQQPKKMARTLEVKVEAIPRLMKGYGNIFLSLCYYRQTLDKTPPTAKGSWSLWRR